MAGMAGAVTAAIRRGVPLWNAGDLQGCVTIYLQTALELQEKDASGELRRVGAPLVSTTPLPSALIHPL